MNIDEKEYKKMNNFGSYNSNLQTFRSSKSVYFESEAQKSDCKSISYQQQQRDITTFTREINENISNITKLQNEFIQKTQESEVRHHQQIQNLVYFQNIFHQNIV